MSPRQAAQSGLACMECFRSKCKCVSRPDGDSCVRCHRLKKTCLPSDPLRKSANAQRRLKSTARISDLEGKVDSLVKLLSLVAQSPDLAVSLHRAAREDDSLAAYEQLLSQQGPDSASTSSGTAKEVDNETARESSRASRFPAGVLSPCGSAATVDSLTNSHIDPHLPSTDESETCLGIFRDKMLPSFSFTEIPLNVTAQQLQRDRPFLMRAIMAVASPTTQQKLAYGRELKQILAHMALVQNQSSLDLLQGLLAFTAWSYDHIFTPSGTLSRLILLATSVVCDLRLDKPLPSDEHMMKPMVVDSFDDENNHSKHRFIAEEQRAVLACYALSSIISIYFAQIDAMKWKPQMEEFLQAIEANSESLSDVAFAFQVRLQLLAQRAVQVREQHELDSARVGSDLGSALSANFHIRDLREQLNKLGKSLPAELQQRGPLIMHMHYIELCMNETARIFCQPAAQGLTSGPEATRNDETNTPGFERLDVSWRSVGAIKAWMDKFFSLSLAECAGLSFIHIAQLARCLMVLYHLSTTVHPAWDRTLVRSTIDLLFVLEGVAEKLVLASREAGELSPDDRFMRLSAMMRNFHYNAAAKMNQQTTAVEDNTGLLNRGEARANGDEGTAIQAQTLWRPMMNSHDDIFLDSIFRDFGDAWSM